MSKRAPSPPPAPCRRHDAVNSASNNNNSNNNTAKRPDIFSFCWLHAYKEHFKKYKKGALRAPESLSSLHHMRGNACASARTARPFSGGRRRRCNKHPENLERSENKPSSAAGDLLDITNPTFMRCLFSPGHRERAARALWAGPCQRAWPDTAAVGVLPLGSSRIPKGKQPERK